MEILGRVTMILPERSGVNKQGNPWKAQQFILQIDDVFHRQIMFEIFGEDKIQLMNVQVGEEIKVFFDIEAREYQGKWFNKVSAWRVERPSVVSPGPIPDVFVPQGSQPQGPVQETPSGYNDLPFDDNSVLPF